MYSSNKFGYAHILLKRSILYFQYKLGTARILLEASANPSYPLHFALAFVDLARPSFAFGVLHHSPYFSDGPHPDPLFYSCGDPNLHPVSLFFYCSGDQCLYLFLLFCSYDGLSLDHSSCPYCDLALKLLFWALSAQAPFLEAF